MISLPFHKPPPWATPLCPSFFLFLFFKFTIAFHCGHWKSKPWTPPKSKVSFNPPPTAFSLLFHAIASQILLTNQLKIDQERPLFNIDWFSDSSLFFSAINTTASWCRTLGWVAQLPYHLSWQGHGCRCTANNQKPNKKAWIPFFFQLYSMMIIFSLVDHYH